MTLELIRVDDRLIHGQVLVGWTRSLGVDHIMVADDKVGADPLQSTLMRMAAPTGVKVSILSIEKAAAALGGGEFDGDRVLALVRGPAELSQLRRAGVPFDRVNVGNVHSGPGRSKLTKEVYASAEELATWRELIQAGVQLFAQWLPDQARTDLGPIVQRG
ncbi:PTS sugar transporter subunit IIB [Streptomyces sp. TS71-3]|uniref:PTS system mannose/fructose/N-acetylgalactosamine-transporter subunit IIB n=1 Tax=Streptomyces sp. TS71-3 TaxID=2733862 RepID=UPI001B2C0CCC|nr:PTS sugar transporter subunit IIB [Streptomyces sp. TS71-3]GHJ41914.1 PTS mannose transporter subunit IIAB [Streptomyces sp. TS71-3]